MTGSSKTRPGPEGLTAMPGAITRSRRAAGMSVTDLAGRVGLSHSHISNVERGRRKVSPRYARSIADALGQPIGELFQL